MPILHPISKCSGKRDLPLPTLDNPGSDLTPTVTWLKKDILNLFMNPCPLPSLAVQAAVSLPPLPPRIAR